ncbi:MAG: peptidoglycan DD-metalloendopeptidase family protein [Pseudomonadota bacterium]
MGKIVSIARQQEDLVVTLFLVLLMLTMSPVAAATESDPPSPIEVRKQIEALEADIRQFQQLLEETQSARSALEKALQDSELEISTILQRIDAIETELKEGEETVESLQEDQVSLNHRKQAQQAQIKAQIRSAWQLGQQSQIKLVLNQDDPHEVTRLLKFHEYVTRARADDVERFRATLKQLAAITEQINHENAELRDRRDQLVQQRETLRDAEVERKDTLTRLNAEIKRAGADIIKRQQDREQLEQLLERITAGRVYIPGASDELPFAARKGKLAWPIVGRIRHSFGSARSDGKLRWDGTLIAAPQGTPVKSVHYGRVVFSDWLRGFGLLMIINHGDGYMSLYGHNSILYRETGDWVVTGEVIATVGDTGGQAESGLYFEIRSGGKPANPKQWCQATSERRTA